MLANVDAFIFDVFGTVVDWRSTVERELRLLAKQIQVSGGVLNSDWEVDFAQEWRNGYIETTRAVANGSPGTLNVDEMHRQILDRMLDTPGSRWASLAPALGPSERAKLNGVWHRLQGWPDSTSGLFSLKKHVIIATLSNGNVRLLVDMAKQSDLPWDVIFSTEFFSSFKPNPKTYLSAARHLSLEPSCCAMVAAHIDDLRAASAVGMKTVYVPRKGEDDGIHEIKTKANGGEVDIVVGSLEELAEVVGKSKALTGNS